MATVTIELSEYNDLKEQLFTIKAQMSQLCKEHKETEAQLKKEIIELERNKRVVVEQYTQDRSGLYHAGSMTTTYRNFDDVKAELVKEVEMEYKTTNTALRELLAEEKEKTHELKKDIAKHKKIYDKLLAEAAEERRAEVAHISAQYEAWKKGKTYHDEIDVLGLYKHACDVYAIITEDYNKLSIFGKIKRRKAYKKLLNDIVAANKMMNNNEDSTDTRRAWRNVLGKMQEYRRQLR